MKRPGTLADTVRRAYGHGLAGPDPENVMFRTDREATPGANAQFGVDDGVEGGWNVQSVPFGPGFRL